MARTPQSKPQMSDAEALGQYTNVPKPGTYTPATSADQREYETLRELLRADSNQGLGGAFKQVGSAMLDGNFSPTNIENYNFTQAGYRDKAAAEARFVQLRDKLAAPEAPKPASLTKPLEYDPVTGQIPTDNAQTYRGRINQAGPGEQPKFAATPEEQQTEIFNATMKTALGSERGYNQIVAQSRGSDKEARAVAQQVLGAIKEASPEMLQEAKWDIQGKASGAPERKPGKAESMNAPFSKREAEVAQQTVTPEQYAQSGQEVFESVPAAREVGTKMEAEQHIPESQAKRAAIDISTTLEESIRYSGEQIDMLQQRLKDPNITPEQRAGYQADFERLADKRMGWIANWTDMQNEAKARGGNKVDGVLGVLQKIGLIMGGAGFGYNGNTAGVAMMADAWNRGTASPTELATQQGDIEAGRAARGAIGGSNLGTASAVNTKAGTLPLEKSGNQYANDLAIRLSRATTDEAIRLVQKQTAVQLDAELAKMANANGIAQEQADKLAQLQALSNARGVQAMKQMFDNMTPSEKEALAVDMLRLQNGGWSKGEEMMANLGVNAAGKVMEGAGALATRYSDSRFKNIYFRYDFPGMGDFMSYALGLSAVQHLTSDERCKDIVEEKKKVAFDGRPKNTKALWGKVAEITRGWN